MEKDRETLIGLKSYTGLRSIDVGSLKVPSDRLYHLMQTAYETTEAQMASAIFGQGVLRCLVECITSAPQYVCLLQSMCGKNRLRQMMQTSVRLQLHSRCKSITAAAGTSTYRMNRRLVTLSSRV